jgi:hypothetical protein
MQLRGFNIIALKERQSFAPSNGHEPTYAFALFKDTAAAQYDAERLCSAQTATELASPSPGIAPLPSTSRNRQDEHNKQKSCCVHCYVPARTDAIHRPIRGPEFEDEDDDEYEDQAVTRMQGRDPRSAPQGRWRGRDW